MSNEVEIEALNKQIAELWNAVSKSHASMAATWALLETCVELLRDDPRFGETHARIANLRASRFLNAAVPEATVDEFRIVLSMLTPPEHQARIQGAT